MWQETIKNAHILIVDDQEANVFFLESILRRSGYTNFRSTNDAREVLPLFQQQRPDLILLDLMMPHHDGFEIMEQLKPLTPEDSYLPILVLTADVSSETRRRALASGAKDFLVKPFDPREAVLRIHNLLSAWFSSSAAATAKPDSRTKSTRAHARTGRIAARSLGTSGSGRRIPRRRHRTAHPPRRRNGRALSTSLGLAPRTSRNHAPRRAAARCGQNRHLRYDSAQTRQTHARRVRHHQNPHHHRRAPACWRTLRIRAQSPKPSPSTITNVGTEWAIRKV